MSDVGLRILQQVNDAQNRRVEEGYESPTARVARARLETEEADRRIESLQNYIKRPDYNFGSEDTTGGLISEAGKRLKRFGERQYDNFQNSRESVQLGNDLNRIDLTDAQTKAVARNDERLKAQKTIEQYDKLAEEARGKGLHSDNEYYTQKAKELRYVASLNRPREDEQAVLNTPAYTKEIERLTKYINTPNSGFGNLGAKQQNDLKDKLKTISSKAGNMSLGSVINNNTSRMETANKREAERETFATDYNLRATKDVLANKRRDAGTEVTSLKSILQNNGMNGIANLFEDSDGAEEHIGDKFKAYVDNPYAAYGDTVESLPYLLPIVGAPLVANDALGSKETMKRNALSDNQRSLLTDEERDRIDSAGLLQLGLMMGGRFNQLGSLTGKSLGTAASGVVSRPITAASNKISNSLANLPKAQKAFNVTSKGLGNAASVTGKVAVDGSTEFLQEAAQDITEQYGSGRKINIAQALDAAAAGAIGGAGIAATGSSISGAKTIIKSGTNAAKKAVNKSTAPMDDANLLDSNSTDYSPVAVVEDASKALSTGNASREVIKESKSRIKNATKTVNKEIQALERLVSLKTKQEKLIADGDIEGATANLKVINDLDNNMSLKVANERLVTVKEAKIAMEAELVRSNNKVSKATDNANTVSQATEVTKLVAELETNKTAIEDLDTQISDTTKSTGEIAALKNQKLKLENKAMATVSKINKLDPEAIKGKLDNISSNTEVNNKTIKEKITGLLRSPEVNTNVTRKAELENLARKLDDVVSAQNTLKNPDNVNGDIVEGGTSGGKKYLGTKEYVANSVKAIDNNDTKSYKKQLGMLKNFEASHTNKVKALKAAKKVQEETGVNQLVYRVKGSSSEWAFKPKASFISKDARQLRKFGALEVHEKSNGLITRIEEEAAHITSTKEFIEEYKSKTKDSDGTNATNDITSDTDNAVDSTSPASSTNEVKETESSKTKPTPKKGVEKDMTHSWNEELKQDKINPNVLEMKKKFKLKDDEVSFYYQASNLANKAITASTNTTWENIAKDTFGDNNNSGKYSKDDVVMVVLPRTEKAFKTIESELKAAMKAGATLYYLPSKYSNNEMTQKISNKNMTAILKQNGYSAVSETIENGRVNQAKSLVVKKATKNEVASKPTPKGNNQVVDNVLNHKSTRSGLTHTVPNDMVDKEFDISYKLGAIKTFSSGLLDKDTEAYTDGLRDIYAKLVISNPKVKTFINLLTDSNKLKGIEEKSGTEFIADSTSKGNNGSVIRINLDNSHNKADIKTILTHELNHSATIPAIIRVGNGTSSNKELQGRLLNASRALKDWFENNKDNLDSDTANDITYALKNMREFIAVGSTQKEVIQQLVNIPYNDGSLYQEVMSITTELIRETYGNKLTKEMEQELNVLSREYEAKQRGSENDTRTADPVNKSTEAENTETSGSTINTGSNADARGDVRQQTKTNVLIPTTNELTQGTKTLLSQDEDIFTSVLLSKDIERIEEFVGTKLEDNNLKQLDAYIEFHGLVTKGIDVLINKDVKGNQNNSLYKYLTVTDSEGKISLPENVKTAISLAAFKYIQTEGKKLKLTDAQLISVHGLDTYTNLYPKAKYQLSEMGSHRGYMAQDMGKVAYAALDLKLGDNARVNTKGELEASLGSVVYNLLLLNTDVIKEHKPLKHKEQLVMLVNSMPLSQAKELVNKKAGLDTKLIKNKAELTKLINNTKHNQYLESYINLSRINNSYNKKTKELVLPQEAVNVIVNSEKKPGQVDLLDKLFSIPRERAEPHDTAPKFTQELAKESRSLLTPEAKKALNEIASYEWGIEAKKADFIIDMFDNNKESLYSLLGFKSDSYINNLHPEIRDGELIETMTKKNLLDQQIEWLKARRKEDGTYKGYYQLPVVWQNSRFGYESTLFNAQTDIFARMLTNLKGWKSTVKTEVDADLFNEDGTVTKEGFFYLALAEKIEGVSNVFGDKFASMGYDKAAKTPDKVAPADYLPEFVNYLNTDNDFKRALSAVRDLMSGEKPTDAKLDILNSFTELADTGELALGTLMEYAAFLDAREAGEAYTTHIGLQSDGITNGPAITDILFGVFNDEKLLKAGIIPESRASEFTNFYDTKKAGYTDKYQDTGSVMQQTMYSYMPKGVAVRDLLDSVDDKFGSRSWAKKLVTPFNYGSGTKAMKRNIANGFIDKVVGDYHSLHNMKDIDERNKKAKDINTLLDKAYEVANEFKNIKPLNNNTALREVMYLHNNNTNNIDKQMDVKAKDLVSEILNNTPKFIQDKNEGKSKLEIAYAYSVFLKNNLEVTKPVKLTPANLEENFSYINRELLENLVNISFGTASAMAINTSESGSVKYRQDITDVTVRAVEMEKFAEDILIDQFVPDSQLPTGIDMSIYESKLAAKRFAMTIGQKKLIDKELDKHRASMHSGLSAKYNASRDSGITVAKEELGTSFGEKIIFGNPLRDGTRATRQLPASIEFTYGYSYKTTGSPGVSAAAMSVQSLDAAIATETTARFKSMNLHDATVFSLTDYVNGVQTQNQEFYDVVTTYDIGVEALESYLRPLRLLKDMLNNQTISEENKTKINNFIHNEVRGRRVNEKTGEEVGKIKLFDKFYNSSLETYTNNKLNKLDTIHTVQQYGGVDGQKVITQKADINKLKSKRDKVIKEAKKLIMDFDTDIKEVVSISEEVNASEIVTELSTDKLSLTGLIGLLSNASENNPINDILNNLADVNLNKVKVRINKKGMEDNVKFSKINNTLYINENAFELITNNKLLREIQRGVLEAALHNNLKAVKNGSSNLGNLNSDYKAMQLLVNSLPSMIDRAMKDSSITKEDKKLLTDTLKNNGGNNVEFIISSIISNNEFANVLAKVPNYTGIDSKDVKSGSIFETIKKFIIDLLSFGMDNSNGESIYNLLAAVSNPIVTNLQTERGLNTINGLINKSMIVNQNQETQELYDYEYDNALLNGYDTQFHLELAKIAANKGNAEFDAKLVLKLAKSLLTNTPYSNDGYNETLVPVIEMLEKYLGSGSKATKVIMVQDRESITAITKNEKIADAIAEDIESGRSLAIKLNDTNYVFLSNAMVSSNADTKIATVVHELLHAFTAETIQNNKDIRTNFEKLRDTAVKQISQEVIDNNYNLKYALDESLPVDEFVVQVLTVPSVRRALEAVTVDTTVKNENAFKEPQMFNEMAALFGYSRESKESEFLNNFAKMFGKLTLNNNTSRNTESEVASLGTVEAYKTARVKQDLIDIGFYENTQQVASQIIKETKDLTDTLDTLNFIKQKAMENNKAELLDDIAKHEQQVYSQRILRSPEVIFTPREIRNKIRENDVSESTNSTYLDIIDNIILGPLNHLIDEQLTTGFNPATVWHDAVMTGENLTVSNAYEVGFELNNEQGYMLEALESVLSKVIDKVNNTAAYRQMESVYQAAKKVIVASDFHDGDWDTATNEEKQMAREKLTYLFRPQDAGTDGKSNYLVRFAALSMVSPEIQKVLNFKENREVVGESWFEKATSLFSNAVEVIDGSISSVNNKGNLNARISELAVAMAKNYAKENDKLTEIENTVIGTIESVQEMFSDTIIDAAKSAGIALTDTAIVQKYPLGRLTNKALKGELDRFQEYADFFLDYVGKQNALGTVRETLNETVTDTSKEQELATDSFNASKVLEKMRGETIDAVRRNILEAYSTKLTKEESKSVSNLLRTDIQSLSNIGLSYNEVMNLVDNKTDRNQKAKELLDSLPANIRNELQSRGDNLAYYLVKGIARKPLLAKNANAILSRVGMSKALNTNFTEDDVKSLDALITLYALNYSDSNTINSIKTINDRESGDKNGLEHSIRSHAKFTKESNALFMDNPFSMQKGYLPSIYNSDKGFAIVKRSQVEEYLELGYVENTVLETALKEDELTSKEDMVFMTISNTGKQDYVSGAFSIDAPGAKGSSVDFESDKFVQIAQRQRATIDTISQTNMIPVYNTEGQISGFRYEMGNTTKDNYLDRNNDFSTLLAQFKGANISKTVFPDSNKRLVDSLIDKAMSIKDSEINAYILISPEASSQRAREFWYMLPRETRTYIQNRTGEKGILVKKNELNLLIGYRKYSPSEAFNKEFGDKNMAELILTSVLEGFFGKKAKLRFDQGYKPLLEVMKSLKNFIIIRGIKVLIANIKSNISLLMINGLTPVQSTKDIKDALVYSIKYQKDAMELAQLEHEISIGYTSTRSISRLTELKNSIARNPLKAFIEQGMMPMIVNDFSFKKGEVEYNTFLDDVRDKTINKLPKGAQSVIDTLLVSEGTPLHNFLANATQQSDFVFKYAIYMQDIRKGRTNKQAIDKAREVFINYDVPTNRFLQFVNDTGLWMFTKFALRIQRVIIRLLKEKPLRLATEALVSEQLGNPSIISLNLLSSAGGGGGLRNPMTNVLSMYEHALPIQLLTSVFK